MIDLRAARADPDRFRAALARKGAAERFDQLLAADARWREVPCRRSRSWRTRLKLKGPLTQEQLAEQQYVTERSTMEVPGFDQAEGDQHGDQVQGIETPRPPCHALAEHSYRRNLGQPYQRRQRKADQHGDTHRGGGERVAPAAAGRQAAEQLSWRTGHASCAMPQREQQAKCRCGQGERAERAEQQTQDTPA